MGGKMARPRVRECVICLSAKLQGARVEVVDDCLPDIMCNKVLRHGARVLMCVCVCVCLR